MSEIWYVLESGAGRAAENMALDEALLEAAARLRRPLLRFYGWTESAATFGYFQRYSAVAGWTSLRPLIRRPTGGGLVPHARDWTYSLIVPSAHEWYALTAADSYQRMHEWIQSAFAALGVDVALAPGADRASSGQCFVSPEKSDLVWKGRKIAGAAQRRRRDGLLIQGSVQPPDLAASREAWQTAMRNTPSFCRDLWWEAFPPDAELRGRTVQLVGEKYSQSTYNEMR